MPSLRELFAGVRNTFSRGAQQESHDDVDLSEPSIDAPRVEDQRRPLYAMVRENKLDDLKAAFDQNADLSTTNMLHNARSPDMVDFLVGKGAKVNQEYDHGEGMNSDHGEPTPLCYAASSANVETIQRLLHHGANPDSGWGQDECPLFEAIARNDELQEPAVRALIDGGASPDGPKYLPSSLPKAVESGARIETINTLLERGADPDGADNNMETALHLAAAKGRTDVADMLLDYGANQRMTNIEGHTPLHNAANQVDMGMVNKLVSRGGDPAGVDSLVSGRDTVLALNATVYGDHDITQKLLDNGANPRLAMDSPTWREAEDRQRNHPNRMQPGANEAMNLVRTHAVEQEKQTLRQTFAEVEHDQSPEVAEQPTQPVARRRVRL